MADTRSALLIVDVQRDFCPGGALAAPEGDRVVQPLNRYIEQAAAHGWPVYASRDWHPQVTRHFRPYGGEWPVHCVEHTRGAEFHPDLRLPPSAIVVSKGQSPEKPGYSAFEGHTPAGRTLADDLRARQIDHLFVGGIATDYCVKHSVLDARRAGLDVTVLADAIAGVDRQPGDSSGALEEMRAAGAKVTESAGRP
ncbi:MAG: nicotinamidase [Acidobacteria bacterium RIFCSPLOWO2_02_FULL_68_18]|nr:MAG: nicotinamidase [Acidobacteria bacterium RIFCSPLOWO2_02_FULL_68_18]OFW50487.1 MAG: nicotinamidase [Acidobacteria bacterium RIFCSPLOWO2_12_FULL_68_19]